MFEIEPMLSPVRSAASGGSISSDELAISISTSALSAVLPSITADFTPHGAQESYRILAFDPNDVTLCSLLVETSGPLIANRPMSSDASPLGSTARPQISPLITAMGY